MEMLTTRVAEDDEQSIDKSVSGREWGLAWPGVQTTKDTY